MGNMLIRIDENIIVTIFRLHSKVAIQLDPMLGYWGSDDR